MPHFRWGRSGEPVLSVVQEVPMHSKGCYVGGNPLLVRSDVLELIRECRPQGKDKEAGREGPPSACEMGWPAPQNLVQAKWESSGRLSHGGTHEQAKDRPGSGASPARSRPRSGQGTDRP